MLNSIKLLPVDEVLLRRGSGRGGKSGGRSKLYVEVAEGTWPPFVKFGTRSVQPEHEVNTMLSAIIAGATEEERRTLVLKLIAQRKAAVR